MASGIINLFFGFGQVLGPLYGAAVMKYAGFRTVWDSLAFLCLFYVMAYWLLTRKSD